MIPTNRGPMTPAGIVLDLTFGCYAYNRKDMAAARIARALELSPDRAAEFEARYQAELAIAKAAA